MALKDYRLRQDVLTLDEVSLNYRQYEHRDIDNGRCLLLLHGAGVAGEDTWQVLISQLKCWQYILVPDLRGMGETYSRGPSAECAFSLDQLGHDICQLLATKQWDVFDMAGYSLGGTLSLLLKQLLPEQVRCHWALEPGLFDALDWRRTQDLRLRYAPIVERLQHGACPESALAFLDIVSPQRRTTAGADQLAISRLLQRPIGFCHALNALNAAARVIDREQLVSAQGEITILAGANSPVDMRDCHRQLAAQFSHWQFCEIAGADHSLPFQKSRQIAKVLNCTAQLDY